MKTDLDLIQTLTKDHVLTKIKACEFPNGRVSSVQVTYGIRSDGKITDEVGLTAFGVVTNDCKSLKLSEGDTIKTVEIGYSSSRISQLSFISQAGEFKVTGTRGRSDLNKVFSFNDDPYSFYGLVGTSLD